MVPDEPLLGTGAGSFEARFVREGSIALPARDAHNLYLETLAELGPVGLALLLATLAVPLTAIPQAAPVQRVGPAAAAAFVAYLLQAGLDWDLGDPRRNGAGIFCAAVLLAEIVGRTEDLLEGHRRAVALAPLGARPGAGARDACRQQCRRGEHSSDRAAASRSGRFGRRSVRSRGLPGPRSRGSCAGRLSSSSTTTRRHGGALALARAESRELGRLARPRRSHRRRCARARTRSGRIPQSTGRRRR